MPTKNSTSLLTATALLTALTALATLFFRIPVGNGYIHLGDSFMVLAALILPRRYACFSAGAGAALADAAGGYIIWAPWTAVIKAVAVLILCATSAHGKDEIKSDRSGRDTKPVRAIAMVITAIWCAAGYYIAEYVIYGNPIVPLAAVPFNLIQMGVGAAVAAFIYKGVLPAIPRRM